MRTLAALLAVLLLSPAVAGTQNPVFSAKVEMVRVDALVTEHENGPAIVGLGPPDFEVYDNGVLQQEIGRASCRERV